MIKNTIFNKKWLKTKYDKEINLDDKTNKETQKHLKKREIINRWIKRIEDGTLKDFNEIQLQTDFIIDIFSNVLGAINYLDGYDEWNVVKEQKTKVDAKKADGILGFFDRDRKDARVIIELKGAKTDLDSKQYRKGGSETPVEQAFSYAAKYGGKCKWIILSNYNEIRLYPSLNQEEYEVFYLADLKNDDKYKRFLYLLSFDSLVSRNGNSKIEDLLENDILNQKKIENEFYDLYKLTRENLLKDIKKHNSSIDIKVILNKVQKILDRFIFICFAQDKALLPNSMLKNAIKNGENTYAKNGIWNELKSIFNLIDKGDEFYKINEFNGGLFKEDKILDTLNIPNEFLKNLKILSEYDYDSDLNVNILGHIFEQSITDIEVIKLNLDGFDSHEKESKKKIDGIYYTPSHITKYIVENTIGEYLKSKRIELGEYALPKITEKDINYKIDKKTKKYKPILSENLEKRLKFLREYRDIVSKIKVLDPACGSGAFLNVAFDYLYKVRYDIDRELEEITGAITFFDVRFNLNKDILQNNLYGVDLNEESVEITKLSLWLKTANKNNKLTKLDDNIKCGNSLIKDCKILQSKAFDWEKEFRDIIKSGGFDIIIGNPPYVDSELMKKNYPKERENIRKNFKTATGNWDLYIPFWELSLNLLNKDGCMALITPNKWLSVKYGANLREYVKNHIYNISDYSKCKIEVFEKVGVSPIVVFAKKEENEGDVDINIFTESIVYPKTLSIENKKLNEHENLGIFLSEHYLLLNKLKQNSDFITKYIEIEEAATVSETYELKEYIKNIGFNYNTNFKMVNTGTIDRYIALWGCKNMRYLKSDYITPVVDKSILEEKFKTRYIQSASPKIIVSGIRYFETIIDIKGEYLAGKSTILLVPNNKNVNDLKFLNPILNSKLITFFLKESYSSLELGGGMNFSKTNISQIPIAKNINNMNKITLENSGSELTELYSNIFRFNKKVQDRLMSKFNISKSTEKLQMPLNYDSKVIIDELNKKLTKKKKLTMKQEDEINEYLTSYKDEYVEYICKINEEEKIINNIVYNMYGLNEKEIDIIDRNSKQKEIFNSNDLLLVNYSYAL
jgi:hypothetical protein